MGEKVKFKVEAWDSLQYLFKTKGINDHILHFTAMFSDKIDVVRLRKAIDLSSESFPLIKCRFQESGHRPVWEKSDHTAEQMLIVIKSKNIREDAEKFLYTNIDTFSGPQMKAGVIRGEKSDALVILMNHMLCDAAGFKDYLYLLSTFYNNGAEMNRVVAPYKRKGRRLQQVIRPFSLLQKIKIFCSENNMSVHDPDQFEFEGDLSTPFIEARVLESNMFFRVKAYAKEHGATVNDMFLAAYIRTLYRYFGHVIAVPCTLDLRKYLSNREAEGICNLVTNLTCDIGEAVGETFEDTLEKVKQCMNQQKAGISCLKSITVLEKVYDFLPYSWAKAIVDKIFVNALIAFTNIGVIDKKRFYFEGVNITYAYMTGSMKYNPYFQLAVSTFDNTPTLSVNLFGTRNDRDKIGRFLDDVVKELLVSTP